MKNLLGIAAFVALGSVLSLAAGCASDEGMSASKDAPQELSDAMMCPTCETVWVAEPGPRGTRGLSRMNSDRQMTCPTCEGMAEEMLMGDGGMEPHNCPECEMTPKKITLDRRPPMIKGGRGG